MRRLNYTHAAGSVQPCVTFCAVGEDYLIPGKDVLVATLMARDRGSKEVHRRTEVKGHC